MTEGTFYNPQTQQYVSYSGPGSPGLGYNPVSVANPQAAVAAAGGGAGQVSNATLLSRASGGTAITDKGIPVSYVGKAPLSSTVTSVIPASVPSGGGQQVQAYSPTQQIAEQAKQAVITSNPLDPTGLFKAVAPIPGYPAVNIESMAGTNLDSIPGFREKVISTIVAQSLTPEQAIAISSGGFVRNPITGAREYRGGTESIWPTTERKAEAPQVIGIFQKALEGGGEYAVFGKDNKLIFGESYQYAPKPIFMGTPAKPNVPSDWIFSSVPLVGVFTNIKTGQYASVIGSPLTTGTYKLLSGVSVSSEKDIFGATPLSSGGVTEFIPVTGTSGMYTSPAQKQEPSEILKPTGAKPDFTSGWTKQPNRFGESATATGIYASLEKFDFSKVYPSGVITAIEPYKFSVLPESRIGTPERLVQFESQGKVMRNVGDILGRTTISKEAIGEIAIGYPLGTVVGIPLSAVAIGEFGYAVSTLNIGKAGEMIIGEAKGIENILAGRITPFEFGVFLGQATAGEYAVGKVAEWGVPKLQKMGILKTLAESGQYSAIVKGIPAVEYKEIAPGIYNLGEYEVTGRQFESPVEGLVYAKTTLNIFGKEMEIPGSFQEYKLSGYQVMQHLNEPIEEVWNLQALTKGTLTRGNFMSEFIEYSRGSGVTVEKFPTYSAEGVSLFSIRLGEQTPTPLIEVGGYTRTLSLEPTISGIAQFEGKYTLGLIEKPLEYTQPELEFLSKVDKTIFERMANIQKTTGAEAAAVWREGKLASFDIGYTGFAKGEFSTLIGEGIEVHTHPSNILPSAGDILGGTRSGYIVTPEAGITRFRATGEVLYSPFENLGNIKVTETFPETIIPKGQKWLATVSISETLKMPVTETYGAMLETGRTPTPFGEISEFTSWGKTETGASMTELTIVDFLTKSGEEPSASIISKGGGYEYIPAGGRQVQIQAMKTTRFVSPEVTIQNLGEVATTIGLGYALLGIVPSRKASASQVAFPKQSYNVPTLSATAQSEKFVPLTTQVTIAKTFSPQAYVQQQVEITIPKTQFVTPNINQGKTARTLNLTRTVDLSKTMDLTKNIDITKTSGLEKTIDLTKTLEMQREVELTKTMTVEIQQPTAPSPWMPPTFPPFGGGGAEILRVPQKSKIFGIGKPKYGRGGPLPLADIASVGITQFKFGAMHSVHQLPITGRTMQKWRKAAGAGFGRGFPTLETEHYKNVSKFPKINIFKTSKKKKRESRR